MTFELLATTRSDEGTGASRRLRHAGKVPAVVYGAQKDAVSVTVDHNTVFYALKNEAYHTAIINLVLDGTAEPVIVRNAQMHPFRPQVQHIDFQRVDLNSKINIRIPLHFKGAEISEAVKLQGKKISYIMSSVEVSVMPSQIPAAIVVDLSGLKAGVSVQLSDLVLPEGVEIVALASGKNQAVALAG